MRQRVEMTLVKRSVGRRRRGQVDDAVMMARNHLLGLEVAVGRCGPLGSCLEAVSCARVGY